MSKFNEGDWAWSPFDGWWKVTRTAAEPYTISHGEHSFIDDGRVISTDIAPSLFTEAEAKEKLGLVREKKMKKGKVECWANVYPDQMVFHKYKTDAEWFALEKTVIATAVHMTGEYEIEDEE